MNSDRNKRENKKALKVFIPVIIAAAVIGGILGAFSSTGTAEEIAKTLGDAASELLFLLSPYIVIGTVITGVAGGICCYKSAQKSYKKGIEEKNEELQNSLFMKADDKISAGMMVMGITEILGLIFFASVVAYLPRYAKMQMVIYLITISLFILGSLARIKLQQLAVDFQKTMSPEKRGSVYDLNFRKKWEDSCDEMEKLIIYKSAYKAYRTGMNACSIFFIILMLLSFFFDYGPLPAMSAGMIWLVTAVSYYREAMRLGKDKIEL